MGWNVEEEGGENIAVVGSRAAAAAAAADPDPELGAKGGRVDRVWSGPRMGVAAPPDRSAALCSQSDS